MSRIFAHPVWLVGFRPFFILALVSGAALPLLWAAIFSGAFTLPANAVTAVQWHAHEMFFGFGWAVMAGFLLTASKNWVKVRGMHGPLLGLAVVLWLLERALFFMSLDLNALIILTSSSVALVIGYVVWTLVRYRKQDTFPDNWLFIIALPLFLFAKSLLLSERFTEGWMMSIGLFRLAFVIMLERTMTQFMKNSLGVELFRNAMFDTSIKGLALLSVLVPFLPKPLSALILAMLSVLLLVRFVAWRPLTGSKHFGIAVMYVGFLGLIAHLLLAVFGDLGLVNAVGNVVMHTFAFVTMGTIIPAMLIRISQGHTGRRIAFTPTDKAAFCAIWVGGVFRLIAPQLAPHLYVLWIGVSATLWMVCFVLIGARLMPFLLQPRVDGRDH